MICYAFPPLGGSGVQRSLKFAKYLPENGWLPIVLAGEAAHPGYDGEWDETLAREFPKDAFIYRASVLDPLSPVRTLWAGSARAGATVPGQGRARRRTQGAVVRTARRLWRRWVYVPDDRIGWLLPALLEGCRILRQHDIRLIYSTSDPFTAHIVGYLLSRVSRRRWVADFRDPWTQYGQYYKYQGNCRKRLDEFVERVLITTPDAVIVPSEQTGELFRAKYGKYGVAPITTISNGFDDEDFQEPQPRTDSRFTLTYAGRFNSPVTESPTFLRSVRLLLDEHPEVAQDFVVRFVGAFGPQSARLVDTLKLGSVVERLGYRSHAECLAQIVSADALLLTINAGPGCEAVYTAKVFEYLAARRPILALIPAGAASQLIHDTNCGTVVGPVDTVAAKDALYDMYLAHKRGAFTTERAARISQFTRRHLTRKLATLMYALVDHERAAGCAHRC